MSLPSSTTDAELPPAAEPVALPVPAVPPQAAAAPTVSLRTLLREIIETVVLTAVIYALVNFATGRFRVEGDSMQPNIHPNEYVLVDKITYRLAQPARGDIVVFNYPLATERDFIKRIIGLPGDTVEVFRGVVSVNGQPLDEPYIAAQPIYEGSWAMGVDEYFVLGDNRNSSSDSHSWGPLDRKYLIGRAVVVYWPPDDWKVVPHYSYAP